MAKLYLGTREVTPSIYTQLDSNEFSPYQIDEGVLSRKSGSLTGNEFNGITSIGSYGLSYAFARCTFTGALIFPSLTKIGAYGLENCFRNCTGITSVDLSSLTEIYSYGLSFAFQSCSNITSVTLSSLNHIASSGMSNTFWGCSKLENIYFNSLTSNSFSSSPSGQFSQMMSSTGSSVTHTLHFPSNLQSTISDLSGYPTFGGASGYVICSFDLPATS